MAYDAEIRVKTKIDNSEVIRLEAALDDVEKKADDAGDALKEVELNRQAEGAAKEAAAGMEELAQKTRKAAEETRQFKKVSDSARIHLADGRTFDWDGNLIEEAINDTVKLENTHTRLAETTEKVEQSMREMGKETRQVNNAIRGIGEDAGDEVEQQITPLRNMMNFIKQSFKDIPIMFGGIASKSTASTRQMETEWDNLSDKAAHYKGVMEGLGRKGLGFGNAEYDAAYVQWQRAEQEVKEYKNQLIKAKEKQTDLKSGLKQVKKESDRTFRKMNQSVKKTGNLMSTMASRMKGILLSLLIFNWISKGFNAMVEGMGKGFENLMGYSSEYANSVQSLKNAMSTLGNSFAAAFAPVVQMVIPWLVQLINVIARAMSYISQFFAILSGKSTFIRAKQVQDAYNKSLDKTGSSAKKAVGALAKFDDLDVWQKNESGGGGGETQPEEMFEEVPVDENVKNWLDDLLEKMKPVLDYIKELKDAFMDGFWDGLGDYEYRFDIIKKGLEQIKKALIDIWTDPNVLAAADNWSKSLMYMLGSLTGSVASIGLTIGAALIGGLGDYLEKNTPRIKKFLISAFNVGAEINYLLADLFQSIAYVLEAFASENGIRFVSALIGSIADAAMGLTEFALKLGRDFLEMLILPFTENADGFKAALEGLLGGVATVLEGVKASIDSVLDHLNAIYDEHIKPLFDSIAAGLSDIVGKFLEVWNTHIQPVIDRIAAKISELLTNYLVPFSNAVIDGIGLIADGLKAFWEAFLQPIVEWIMTYAIPFLVEGLGLLLEFIIAGIGTIVDGFTQFMTFLNDYVLEPWKMMWESAGDMFDSFWNMIKRISDAIITAFRGFVKMIRQMIDGDWKGAWNTAQDIFTTFKDKVTGIVDSIKDFLSGFFTWVSDMISGVIDGIKNIGSNIKSALAGEERNSRSVPVPAAYDSETSGYISAAMARIPALASGAVIRGGNPFLAILGDQPAGRTNIEAPLSTIERAVENVMGRYGYGGGINPTISLNLDGQEFARLTLQDILNEAARQGYNVEVLGVT